MRLIFSASLQAIFQAICKTFFKSVIKRAHCSPRFTRFLPKKSTDQAIGVGTPNKTFASGRKLCEAWTSASSQRQ